MKPRVDALKAIGMPPDEALAEIRAMPDVASKWQRLGQEGAADPRLQHERQKLLDRMR